MKINKLQTLLIAALAFAGASCSQDNNLNMVPDSLYLHNAGVNEVTVYNGINSPTEVVVVKAGKGFTGANVTLKVDESLLNGKYSEGDYIALPADCYSFDVTTLEFGKDDYLKSFKITWDFAKLNGYLQQALNEEFEYVLPLQLVNNTASTIELKADRNDMILVPVMDTPTVKFTSEINASGIYVGEMPVVGKLEDYVAHFPVETNFQPIGEFKFTIEVDESLVAEFNQEHGTNYQVLPADYYSFESMDWTFPADQKIGYCEMVLHEKKLQPNETTFLFGSYMLPIRLKSVNQGVIDENSAVIPYVMEFNPIEISRSNWVVMSYSSCGKDDPNTLTAANLINDLPSAMLDGKSTTQWTSCLSAAGIERYPLPYTFDFDMDGSYRLIQIQIDNPTGSKATRATLKKAHFEYSNDGKEWLPLGEPFEAEKGVPVIRLEVPIVKAAYLRFVIEEVYNYTTSTTDINGPCSITELRVWHV